MARAMMQEERVLPRAWHAGYPDRLTRAGGGGVYRRPMKKLLPVAVLSLFVGVASAQGSCACPVTNQGTVTTASGTCVIVGQGSIACFQMAIGSVPGAGTPAPGHCAHKVGETWVCNPPETGCTYQPIRFVITAASCFASCGARNPSRPTYSPPSSAPQSIPILGAGGTQNYDVNPPGTAANNCGSPPTDVLIQFTNNAGSVIFEVRARFQCGQCSAKVNDS